MDEQIGHFLNFLSVEKGSSGNTVSAYRNDLTQFDSYVTGIAGNGRARDWEGLERTVIINYLLALRGKNYAEATVARKVAAIKSFFQYLQAEGTIRRNPAESLESPRVGRPTIAAAAAGAVTAWLPAALRSAAAACGARSATAASRLHPATSARTSRPWR